jgi:CRP-like cAMP-binding protein
MVSTVGPGDGFGEIALLRRVRRTAMVRAATDLELQALTCDRFLPVVTGFRPSSPGGLGGGRGDARPIQP